jgi:mono/diheme cytochrome c family protein
MTGKTMRLSTLAAAVLLAASALPALAQSPAPDALEPRVKGGRFVMRDGEAIYRNVCQACHMADAKGAQGSGIYPALAANPRLAAAAYPIRVIVNGQKGMPSLGALFDDDQVAAVVAYVRTHFGNSYAGAVTAAEVKAQRPAAARAARAARAATAG